MIGIETIKGYLVIHEEYINSIFFDKGKYYLTTINGRFYEKWEITQGSYKDLLAYYGKEKEEKN